MEERPRQRIAIGPASPGIGSWEWVGAETGHRLQDHFDVVEFQDNQIPECDLIWIVKQPIHPQIVIEKSSTTPIIYSPIDFYGSPAQIDADAAWLTHCDRILVHCQELARYFRSYAPTDYIDHQVRFFPEHFPTYKPDSFVLWVGMQSQISNLANWVNEHQLPSELRVLTNLNPAQPVPAASLYGFDTYKNSIRLGCWSPARHLDWVDRAGLAIDIKGNDFRQRHKPSTKAIDFIAAGLPLAMNSDSSSVRHLKRLGFDVPSPENYERWKSQSYFEQTQRFGRAWRELFSLSRISMRYQLLFEEVWKERRDKTTQLIEN